MNIILFISVIFLTLILNYIFIQKKIFLNFKGDVHQKFISSRNIPLSGGLSFNFYIIPFSQYIQFIFYLLAIFCVGFFSDIKIINSPKLRFIIQFFIVLGVVYFFSITVPQTKIIFLDQLLDK